MSSSPSGGQALLIEDDDFARLACSSFLRDFDLEVHCAATYEEAQRALFQRTYRLVVADLSLRREHERLVQGVNSHGLDLIRAVKQRSPDTAVVIWTAYPHLSVHVLDLVMQNCRGFACVPKGNMADVLREGIIGALDGDVVLKMADTQARKADEFFLSALTPEIAKEVRRLAAQIATLTPRQREVADLLTCTTEVIARRLSLTQDTVRKYIDAIYDRLYLKEPAVQALRRDTLIVLAVLVHRLSTHTGSIIP